MVDSSIPYGQETVPAAKKKGAAKRTSSVAFNNEHHQPGAAQREQDDQTSTPIKKRKRTPSRKLAESTNAPPTTAPVAPMTASSHDSEDQDMPREGRLGVLMAQLNAAYQTEQQEAIILVRNLKHEIKELEDKVEALERGAKENVKTTIKIAELQQAVKERDEALAKLESDNEEIHKAQAQMKDDHDEAMGKMKSDHEETMEEMKKAQSDLAAIPVTLKSLVD
ncbi:hypothetical protein TI39_contig303g00020 [Zymoseptoria brevis]|uniref:Uncharacterized protein n=1 Tax=Zymoseptoria brevis TaxID=1047168 RepID=A0A0F4GUN5_9PEZI|nr:hypothetical protein TI39_contig303g00020 [Zymoseptoria brevis]